MKKTKAILFLGFILICMVVFVVGQSGSVEVVKEGPTPSPWKVPAIETSTPTLTPTPGWWEEMPTPMPLKSATPTDEPTETPDFS